MTRRWFILFAIFLAQANGTIIYSTLNPIAIPVANAFELSTVFYVNMTIMAQMFNPIPMTFLSIWMYSNFKTSNVLRGLVTVQLIGAACRALCIFSDNFWLVAVGQYLSSCCNPFFLNVQFIIANKWFTDTERAFATALQIVASPVGAGLSMVMTGVWFRDSESDDPEQFLADFK